MRTRFTKPVGQMLKETREDLGLSLNDLSKEIKSLTGVAMSKSFISRVESGDRKPSLDSASVMFAALAAIQDEN